MRFMTGRVACCAAAAALAGCAGLIPYAALERGALGVVDSTRELVTADQRSRRDESTAAEKIPGAAGGEQLRNQIRARFGELTRLSSADALRVAAAYNREYLIEHDSNLAAALSLVRTRHGYGPQWGASVKAEMSAARATAAESVGQSQTYSGSITVSDATAAGDHLSITASTSETRDESFSGAQALSMSFTRELLKDGGRLVNGESLRKAERNALYRLRTFELFRQGFAIRTMRTYFDLVSQRQVVENTRRALEQADFLYRRAEALFSVGRTPEIDVFQAEYQRLQAETDLRDAEEGYRDQVLAFKIFLGLPDDVPLDINPDERPPFRSVTMAPETAIALAHANRLDLATRVNQLEDAERNVRIARNDMLPGLAFGLSAATANPEHFDDFTSRASLQLTLPLDRLDERIALKSARVALEQERRGLELFRDNLTSEVRRLLRNLARVEKSIGIQAKIVKTSDSRLQVAEVRFRQGRLPSRDTVEAQNDLLRAQNTSARLAVEYAITELEFRKAIGLLRIGADGSVEDEPLPRSTPAVAPAVTPAPEAAPPALNAEPLEEEVHP
jgi:outer membrane protein TolC